MKRVSVLLVLLLSGVLVGGAATSAHAAVKPQSDRGGFHTVSLRADGSLWAFGDNYYRQLGLGDTAPRLKRLRVGVSSDRQAIAGDGFRSLALEANGSNVSRGRGRRPQGRRPSPSTR